MNNNIPLNIHTGPVKNIYIGIYNHVIIITIVCKTCTRSKLKPSSLQLKYLYNHFVHFRSVLNVHNDLTDCEFKTQYYRDGDDSWFSL